MVRSLRLGGASLCALFGVLAFAGARASAEENLAKGTALEVKIKLLQGDTYLKGATEPVANLKVEITLTNTTPKETGVGELYKPIMLSPLDFIEFLISPLPEEGEPAAEGAKPKLVPRDMPLLPGEPTNLRATKYLGPGDSETVALDVGKYYAVRKAGQYTMKARLFGANGIVSNEEKFRVLPFKKVDASEEVLRGRWKQFERGEPDFPFMFYQVQTTSGFDEILYIRRVTNDRTDHYEFHRLCSVLSETSPQVGYLGPKKVAVLAKQRRGDWALYTVDFAPLDPKVDVQAVAAKEPKLKVEGGKASAE